MDNEIIIKITIPESEYKEWNEYQVHGIEGAMESIKDDVRQRLRQDFVRNFEIEVTQGS